jgi:hypothetical protein
MKSTIQVLEEWAKKASDTDLTWAIEVLRLAKMYRFPNAHETQERKARRGRPAGSKNKPKEQSQLPQLDGSIEDVQWR